MTYIIYSIISIIILFLLFYKFIFLRDNGNLIPKGENIVSPASGKVISIKVINGNDNSNIKIRKGFFGQIDTEVLAKEPYYLINIFMSPFDVHITKMPINGEILNVKRIKGSFKPVTTLKAGLANEKQEFLIKTRIGLIKVIQIAGFLARRTRSYVSQGKTLNKGDKLGIILLGSQTALLFPKKDYILKIKEGDKVSSGETIICEI